MNKTLASVLIQLLQPVKRRLLQKIGRISATSGLPFCKEHNLKMLTSYIYSCISNWLETALVSQAMQGDSLGEGEGEDFTFSSLQNHNELPAAILLQVHTKSNKLIGGLWARAEFSNLFSLGKLQEGRGDGSARATGKHARSQLNLHKQRLCISAPCTKGVCTHPRLLFTQVGMRTGSPTTSVAQFRMAQGQEVGHKPRGCGPLG